MGDAFKNIDCLINFLAKNLPVRKILTRWATMYRNILNWISILLEFNCFYTEQRKKPFS